MKNLVLGLAISAVCVSLAADSTGRVSFKVTTKAGAPIANAKILMERDKTEMNWSKTLTTDAKGAVMQVGLAPKNYDLTISADGYVSLKANRKVPLGDALTETFVLLTPEESRQSGHGAAGAPVDAASAKDMEGSAAFNAAVTLYNEQKFAEALPLVAKAHKALVESIAKQKDATAKTEAEAKLPTIERVYGIVLMEGAQTDEEKKANAETALPLLESALARNPKDQRILTCLIAAGKAKGDEALQQKYQAALDILVGPRPELAYNDAVTAFNAGDFKRAKASVTKAIAADPKFSDSYWLLGVVEFSLANPKAAKESFKKYMEIAPTGKKAAEVKEFLRELR